jgi:hypothetical protein
VSTWKNIKDRFQEEVFMKKRFSIATAAALALICVFAGMEIQKLVSADDIYTQLSKFNQVLSTA